MTERRSSEVSLDFVSGAKDTQRLALLIQQDEIIDNTFGNKGNQSESTVPIKQESKFSRFIEPILKNPRRLKALIGASIAFGALGSVAPGFAEEQVSTPSSVTDNSPAETPSAPTETTAPNLATPEPTPTQILDLKAYVQDPNPTEAPTQDLVETIKMLMENKEKEDLAKYYVMLEAKGCKDAPEQIKQYARVMNCVEHSSYLDKFVTTEDVLNYSVNHKGLNWYKVDGLEKILLPNTTEEFFDTFTKFCDKYNKLGNGNFVDFLLNNGLAVYLNTEYSTVASQDEVLVYQEGMILVNHGPEKKLNYDVVLLRHLIEESIGIFWCNYVLSTDGKNAWLDELGGAQVGGMKEITKNIVARKVYAYLYYLTGEKDKNFKDLCLLQGIVCKSFADKYGIPLDDPRVIRQTDLIMSLIFPVGTDNWDFVEEGLGEIKSSRTERYTDQQVARYELIGDRKKDYTDIKNMGMDFLTKKRTA